MPCVTTTKRVGHAKSGHGRVVRLQVRKMAYHPKMGEYILGRTAREGRGAYSRMDFVRGSVRVNLWLSPYAEWHI